MSVRVLAATHTHLYPGARLHSPDGSPNEPLTAGDAIVVEFSDGHAANAQVLSIETGNILIAVQGHRTSSGTDIPAQRWRMEKGTAPGEVRINARG
jgi:hypothetical protein